MAKVEFKVPVYLLLSDDSLRTSGSRAQRMARISIEDRDDDGKLDLKTETVRLNGVDLSEKQSRELFARLGFSRAQGTDLGFAQKFFGRLGAIAEKVGQGKFRDVEDVDNALVRDEKDFLRPMAYGIESPTRTYVKIKEAAYEVARKRAAVEKGICRLEMMISRSDPNYWELSRHLKAAGQRCGMDESIARLEELDRKAACNPILKDCA